ncbi:MAG: SRPBCC family protein [Hyphomonadaceae bacterium]|nr:SRPBCC family protein [Hyphomonadaceae bacterium]
MLRALVCALALLAGAADPARAEVAEAGPGHFQLRFSDTVEKPPADVWRAIGRIGAWWDSAHTYSGEARNMRLAVRAGGCFCEVWDGASVEHMRAIYVRPQEALRLDGALGPLQEMGVVGILTMTLAAEGARTRLTWTYRVVGPGGDLSQLAAPVDAVVGQQFARLVRYAETGSPN